ncbi:MAG: cell surface protein [Lachnospiraceae bacterium]|nr:cell surface protein [Lachnospiraceae bacterium]
MKHSKRYIVLAVLLLIVFLFKFQVMRVDAGRIDQFRGGTLDKDSWYPLVAEDVNGKLLTLVIDNKEYTNEKYLFYMDHNRNIMVPVDILRDAMNCSAHLYDGSHLLVEKHNYYAQITLNEQTAISSGDAVLLGSNLVEFGGNYYVSLTDLAKMLGYSFSFDVTTNTIVAADMAENISSLPAKYDLRDRYRVPTVRDQGKLGTCWAFGAVSALESSLLPEDSYVFSADHMSLSNSFATGQNDGGEYTMSMAYLAAWQGPVYEVDDPYGDGESNNKLTAVKHVQEMRIIASKDIAAIKEAVFKYGGVQTSLYSSLKNASSSSKYYNKETHSYCYIGTNKPNHDVVIVGWDDNYPKENFNTSLEGDGAFICQNSWGTSFGENGVFYVSYYDSNIGTHNLAYTRVEDKDNYDNIYQSDLCGWVGKLGYEKESMYGANVFTAKSNEEVVAAGFYATAPDTEYKVYVVSDFTGVNSFRNRQLVAEGVLEDAGYYTVDFENGVSVKEGKKYAVVVYVKTPGSTHPMAIEYNTGDKKLANVDLEDGEGYISYSGNTFINVKDKQDCNLCIKAFTNGKENTKVGYSE